MDRVPRALGRFSGLGALLALAALALLVPGGRIGQVGQGHDDVAQLGAGTAVNVGGVGIRHPIRADRGRLLRAAARDEQGERREGDHRSGA